MEKIPVAKIKPQGVIAEKNDSSGLYDRSRFGTIYEKDFLLFSNLEALYLVKKKKLIVKKGLKKLDFEKLLEIFEKDDHKIWLRYTVFEDLRNAGYIVKTAVKFGADFRVYDKGVKPGEDHAKWVVFPVKEDEILRWQEFSAKNRVANSTKKKLLIAILDAENDVVYYEVKWIRP